MHQPQPLHLSLSNTMLPVSSDCVSASLGHAATQAGSSQSLQVTAMLANWLTLTTRMRDLSGLKAFSLVNEQAYSHIWQPTHFSGSAETNFLSCIFTMFYASFPSIMLENSSKPSSLSLVLVGMPSTFHPRAW